MERTIPTAAVAATTTARTTVAVDIIDARDICVRVYLIYVRDARGCGERTNERREKHVRRERGATLRRANEHTRPELQRIARAPTYNTPMLAPPAGRASCPRLFFPAERARARFLPIYIYIYMYIPTQYIFTCVQRACGEQIFDRRCGARGELSHRKFSGAGVRRIRSFWMGEARSCRSCCNMRA